MAVVKSALECACEFLSPDFSQDRERVRVAAFEKVTRMIGQFSISPACECVNLIQNALPLAVIKTLGCWRCVVNHFVDWRVGNCERLD